MKIIVSFMRIQEAPPAPPFHQGNEVQVHHLIQGRRGRGSLLCRRLRANVQRDQASREYRRPWIGHFPL
jgi:hypothetical protein